MNGIPQQNFNFRSFFWGGKTSHNFRTLYYSVWLWMPNRKFRVGSYFIILSSQSHFFPTKNLKHFLFETSNVSWTIESQFSDGISQTSHSEQQLFSSQQFNKWSWNVFFYEFFFSSISTKFDFTWTSNSTPR